jgi:hypothetical protein
MLETTHCVKCLRPARRWTGYCLTPDGTHVAAGWCGVACEVGSTTYLPGGGCLVRWPWRDEFGLRNGGVVLVPGGRRVKVTGRR